MHKLFAQYGGLKREMYVLFFGRIVTAMGAFVWPMMTFFLTRELQFTDSRAALVIALMTTLSIPAALLGGRLSDRFSRKTVIVVFDIGTVLFYSLAALIPFGLHTIGFIFVAGLFQTMESPAYDALNADYSTTEQRERAFSLSYLGYNLGFIVGAGLSGVLYELDARLIFLVNGASILISTLLILFFVDPKHAVGQEEGATEESFGPYEKPVEASRGVLSVLADRRVVLFMLLVGCAASMPNILVGILLPLQLKDAPAVYGFLNSLNGAVVIVFTPILTMLLARRTEIPKTILGLLLFVAGGVFFAVGRPVGLLFFGMFIYTLGEVVTVLGQNPYASRRIPASHRGRIGGITSVVYAVFSSLTQFIISALLTALNGNYTTLWTIFLCIGLLAALLYALLYRADRATFPLLYVSAPSDGETGEALENIGEKE